MPTEAATQPVPLRVERRDGDYRVYFEAEAKVHDDYINYEKVGETELAHLSSHCPGVVYGSHCLGGIDKENAAALGMWLLEFAGAEAMLEAAAKRLDEEAKRRLIMFDGGPELLSHAQMHRHHTDEPYIGCVFCQEKFVLAEEHR